MCFWHLLTHFGHLMQRADSFDDLMLGNIEGRRRRGRQRMRWLDGITDSMDMGLGGLRVGGVQGGLACCGSWGHKESDTTEWLNWTEHNVYYAGFTLYVIVGWVNLIGYIKWSHFIIQWLLKGDNGSWFGLSAFCHPWDSCQYPERFLIVRKEEGGYRYLVGTYLECC